MALDLQEVLRKKRLADERADRPKVDWFSIKQNSAVRVRFLQEFSTDSPSYDSARGTVLFLAEHVSPYSFQRRAECTFDSDGRCFACEMAKEETEVTVKGEVKPYPWKQRSNMYTWVMTEDLELKLLSRPAPGAFFDQMIDFQNDDGEGSITQHEFKISKGAQRNDKWNLVPQLKTSFEVPELVELLDLEQVACRKVPYAEQKKFYIPEQEESSEPVVTQTQASSQNYDW